MIGILGVTVLLLLATIAFMVRKNKQKIFNKQSLFKSSPLSEQRHMMRDLTNSTKLYEEATTPLNEDFLGRHSQIYQEPHEAAADDASYRFILRCPPNSNLNNGAYRQRNSSCGRLCDYDVPLIEQGRNQATTATFVRMPSAKNKFGSTPMFNNMGHMRVHQQPQAKPHPAHQMPAAATLHNNSPYVLPASFSCHEVKSGYSTPQHPQQPHESYILPHSYSVANGQRLRLYEPVEAPPVPPPEPFYAATDIFNKELKDGSDRIDDDDEDDEDNNTKHII